MLARAMRAIVVREVGAPSVMKLENVPVPEPAKNQILLQVKAAGVNPVDTYIRGGLHGRKPALPYTPGMDAAGIVEKVGSDVTRFKKGDRVFISGSTSGAYAEYATALETRTFELPDNVSFEQGAALGVPYFTAYRALFQVGRLRAGQSLFVRGASGAVGMACVQLARRRGVTEISGTAGTEDGVRQLSSESLCGPNRVYNHRSADYHETIKSRVGGKGFDMIVEVLANANFGQDLELVGLYGTIVIVGSRGQTSPVDCRNIMVKECNVTGVMLYNSSDADYAEAAADIVAGLREKVCLPMISSSFKLEEAAAAHEQVMAESKNPGKVIITI